MSAMQKGDEYSPPLASKANILRSIFPEITVRELEEILELCGHSLKGSCDEITRRLKNPRGSSTTNKYRGSVVQLYREYEGECHYCKEPGAKSIAYGMNSDQMTVDDFQFLLERGWARCGKWIYLPSNHKVCCPTYTIRLDVDKFVPNKSQRRQLKRFERYIKTGSCTVQHTSDKKEVKRRRGIGDKELQFYKEKIHLAYNIVRAELGNSLPEQIINQICIVSCKKKLRRDLACNICWKLRKDPQGRVELAQAIASHLPDVWMAECCNGFINFNRDPSFRSLDSQQDTQIPTNLQAQNITYLERRQDIDAHKLEVTLEDPIYTNEKFELYKHYQSTVHQSAESSSELQVEGFKDFLCKTPLIRRECEGADDPSCGFGSFHQLYRLDGKLIAIGVIDILPRCLSSTYFIYDPDFSFLALGVISALGEIQMIKDVLLRSPNSPFRYYYLGYYVHTCPKVRYKSAYKPSEMLCPITLQWVPMEIVEKILDETKYCRFAGPDVPKQPPFYGATQLSRWIRSYSLIIGGTPCLLINLTEESQKRIGAVLHEFVKLAGDEVAVRLSYFFS